VLRFFYRPKEEKDMKKYFVVSDHHFYHKNIIEYEGRPFLDLNHMHGEIIKNHNGVVGKNDVVFFLGDVSFSNKENTEKLIKKMGGKKILIMGNHDTRSRKWYLDVGFDEVISYPIIYNKFFILSHEPVYLNNTMPYVNIHGHIHGQNMENKHYVNVSLEQIKYTPILLTEIVNRFKMEELE